MKLANSAQTSVADGRAFSAAQGVPNQPMVPTAHDWPNDNSIDPMRRHIGQSLGGSDVRTESACSLLAAIRSKTPV